MRHQPEGDVQRGLGLGVPATQHWGGCTAPLPGPRGSVTPADVQQRPPGLTPGAGISRLEQTWVELGAVTKALLGAMGRSTSPPFPSPRLAPGAVWDLPHGPPGR